MRDMRVAGDLEILGARQTPWIALFCSRKYPGSLILPTFDAISSLRETGRVVVGGFHSPMEQECLQLLLRGTQSVVVCPARGIQKMRLPGEWRKPLAEKRLLILSPFAENQNRKTAGLAEQRNEFVAALADEIFIVHAPPGSQTHTLAANAIRAGKRAYTIADPANEDLLGLGLLPWNA